MYLSYTHCILNIKIFKCFSVWVKFNSRITVSQANRRFNELTGSTVIILTLQTVTIHLNREWSDRCCRCTGVCRRTSLSLQDLQGCKFVWTVVSLVAVAMPTLLSLILPLYWVRLQCRVRFTNHNHDTTHLCPLRALFNCFLTYRRSEPSRHTGKLNTTSESATYLLVVSHFCTYLLSYIFYIKPALAYLRV